MLLKLYRTIEVKYFLLLVLTRILETMKLFQVVLFPETEHNIDYAKYNPY